MAEAALEDYEGVPIPRKLKISSKRQITIPVDVYERHGFADYALLTETEGGLTIEPLNLADDDEDLTLKLLRYLIDKGYDGEDLLDKYEEIKPMFISIHRAIERSEADIAAGRVMSFDDMQREIKKKYGLDAIDDGNNNGEQSQQR